MPAPRSRRRARIAALVSVVLAITGFQFFLAPPAAQACRQISAFPYIQDWSYGAGGNTWSGPGRGGFVELTTRTASAQSTSGLTAEDAVR